MGKKTVFTNITPLPSSVTREVAIAMLHNHDEMIELNPLVIEHHPIKTPRDAPKDEFLDCVWQEMTDRVQLIPGGMLNRKVTYKGCFHDLPNGLQTHIYAPMGLDIREKWTICGALPGEPDEPRELGLNTPRRGLYLREDGEMKCNMLMTGFVRKNLDNSHKVLVERILAKAERVQAHLNASKVASPQGSVSSAMPAFQAGSHMSHSTIIRQLTQSSQSLENGELQLPVQASSGTGPVRSVTTPPRREILHELPGSSLEILDKPLPRQPSEEEDDAELAAIHPALREQYRQSKADSLRRNDTGLPAYHTLKHQRGQFYHEDMAKRPAGKQFAAELEGSPGIGSSASASAFASASGSASGSPQDVGQHSTIPIGLDGGHDGSYLPRTMYGDSRTTGDSPLLRNMPAHARSQSQPATVGSAYGSTPSSGGGPLDRCSVVSGISDMPTPRQGQGKWGDEADVRFSVVSAMTDTSTQQHQQRSVVQDHERRGTFF